jgi:hypothetical protein
MRVPLRWLSAVPRRCGSLEAIELEKVQSGVGRNCAERSGLPACWVVAYLQLLPQLCSGCLLPEVSFAVDAGAHPSDAGAKTGYTKEAANVGVGPDSGETAKVAAEAGTRSDSGEDSSIAGGDTSTMKSTPDGGTSMCGDGNVNGYELCDTAIADGRAGACPKSCTPMDACTPRVVQGTACMAACAPMPITKIGAKDGCCPPNANAMNDVDCKAKCGNGVIEANETCDPPGACAPCTASNACLAVKSTGSADTCDLRCSQSPITQCHNGDHCCPSGCSRVTVQPPC